MTMFKTKEQIENMASKAWSTDSSCSFDFPEYLYGFKEGATWMQKDLLESASKDSQDAWINYRKGEGHSFGHKEALDYGWQACALFHKAKIDTLKQRELGYQSDLRQKDDQIDRLKKKIGSFDAYASADEKYQEAVKDIEWLTQFREYDTYTELDKLYAIQTKYGLNKKEG